MTLKPFHVLLADDDRDDRSFFSMALKAVNTPTRLDLVEDGEELMAHLVENAYQLPDVLFLDHNMPRKNGAECLAEIKLHPQLKALPVIIYSTSLRDEIADLFYENGAHYYVKKGDIDMLIKIVEQVFTLLANSPEQPTRENFILTAQKSAGI